jgi:hypothetical protein
VTPAASGGFIGAGLVASALSRRRMRPLEVSKHMIDDPPVGPSEVPGNRGRKCPPFQTGFLTLPPTGLPKHPGDEHNGDKDDEVDQRHTDLRHRLTVDTETRSCAAASRVDR